MTPLATRLPVRLIHLWLLLRHQIILWRVLWCQPRFLLVRHFNPHWHFLSCEEDFSFGKEKLTDAEYRVEGVYEPWLGRPCSGLSCKKQMNIPFWNRVRWI